MSHWSFIKELENPMSCYVVKEGKFIGNGFTCGVPRRREYELNSLRYGWVVLHKVMVNEKSDAWSSVLVLEQISEGAKTSSEILLV